MMEESGVVETVSEARADGIMDVRVRRNQDRWRIVGRQEREEDPGFVCIKYDIIPTVFAPSLLFVCVCVP